MFASYVLRATCGGRHDQTLSDPRQRPSDYALAISGANLSSRREYRALTPIIRPISTSTGLAAFIPGEPGYASPLGVRRLCSGPLQRLQPLAIGTLRHLHQQRSARYAVNAIDAAPAPGLLVQVGHARPVTTDTRGYFQADITAPGAYETTISDGASTIVDRRTTVNLPAAERTRFSLIPASFDLQAVDEMFRATNARLQRWTTRPSLVVLASVMSLRGGSGGLYSATSEQMTDEASKMTGDLTEGSRC